jgi:hypothetical protein
VAKETLEEYALRVRLAALAVDEGGPLSDGIPVRWLQNPTWRCANHHVSKRFQHARRGRRVCVFRYCGQVIQPTFPEDRSGPLPAARVAIPQQIPASETGTAQRSIWLR